MTLLFAPIARNFKSFQQNFTPTSIMHRSMAVTLLALAATPFAPVAADPAFQISLQSAPGCAGGQITSYTFQTSDAPQVCGAIPLPPKRDIAKRANANRKCLSVGSAQSWAHLPASADNFYTLYVHTYTSDDCSGDFAAAYSTDAAGCVEFEGDGDVKSVEAFISQCGSPWRE
ncbi:uncharacterized protein LTR77_010728 [Saxophila tyrrhenica]|uniref:Uncharacterized protein n=1 Tax=Saxophila tyrrhenica TaxID=1690608 RepID=A0AAV9NUS7_9PEZI|nr:hypothetical protein LTR77_010728 [Saxophila tyrrhenica]